MKNKLPPTIHSVYWHTHQGRRSLYYSQHFGRYRGTKKLDRLYNRRVRNTIHRIKTYEEYQLRTTSFIIKSKRAK